MIETTRDDGLITDHSFDETGGEGGMRRATRAKSWGAARAVLLACGAAACGGGPRSAPACDWSGVWVYDEGGERAEVTITFDADERVYHVAQSGSADVTGSGAPGAARAPVTMRGVGVIENGALTVDRGELTGSYACAIDAGCAVMRCHGPSRPWRLARRATPTP